MYHFKYILFLSNTDLIYNVLDILYKTFLFKSIFINKVFAFSIQDNDIDKDIINEQHLIFNMI